jgi:hypothetical protein
MKIVVFICSVAVNEGGKTLYFIGFLNLWLSNEIT